MIQSVPANKPVFMSIESYQVIGELLQPQFDLDNLILVCFVLCFV